MILDDFRIPTRYGSMNSPRNRVYAYLNKNIQYCIKKNKGHLEIMEVHPSRFVAMIRSPPFLETG